MCIFSSLVRIILPINSRPTINFEVLSSDYTDPEGFIFDTRKNDLHN
jgi:hypothetical protein